MKNKKIAVIFDRFIVGGIQTVGINYLKILKELGWSTDVYVLTDFDDDMINRIPSECNIIKYKFGKKNVYDAYISRTNKYKILKFILPFIKFYSNNKTKKAKKHFMNVQYDVVIAFSGHYNDLHFAANCLSSEKYISWLHGLYDEYIEISPSFESLFGCFDKMVSIVNTNRSLALPQRFKMTTLYNPCSIHLTHTNNDKVRELKEKYGNYLLFVARFANQKDHKTLIDALSIIKNKYDINVPYLLFVGVGPTEEYVKNYAEKSDVSDKIVFCGKQMDVVSYYKSAYLFTHSSFFEGLPTTLVESLGCELPIIATNSEPGVSEVLAKGEYGIIVEIGDAESLASEIVKQYKHPKINFNMKKKGYDWYMSKFSFNSIKEDFSNLLEE